MGGTAVRLLGSLATIVAGVIVVLVALAWHYSNTWAAHLRCPVKLGTQGALNPGGWANPAWCEYPIGDSVQPEKAEFSWLTPAWSAAVLALTVILVSVVVVLVLRWIRRWGRRPPTKHTAFDLASSAA